MREPSIILCATGAPMTVADVDALGADSLDADERARALALRSDTARGEFVTRRAQLRNELADLTAVRHEHIRYWREPCTACGEPHGRPRAVGHDGFFSTSSTPWITALAFADVPVGIDVEVLASASTVTDISPLLHLREQAAIDAARGVDPDAGRRVFTRIWTRKEALLKATGEGLNAPLDRDDVSDLAHTPPGRLIVDIGDDLDGYDGPPTFGAWAMRCDQPQPSSWRRASSSPK